MKCICRWGGIALLAATFIFGCSASDDVTQPSGSPQLAVQGGACCFADSCSVLTTEECTTGGGVFQGEGTVCDPNPCIAPATGACCYADGSCSVLSADDCAAGSGVYQGDDTVCDPNPCPQPPPTGACCYADGSCSVLSADDCAAGSGVYQGDDTVCDPNPCPPPPTGACCHADGSCSVLTADDCAGAAGAYMGDDTVCDPNPCVDDTELEACGLGFWKNHSSIWEPTGYEMTDPLSDAFSFPAELAEFGDDTLLDALRYPGGDDVDGGVKLLLRTAVVALLNGAHPDVNYALSVPEVVTIVNDGLTSLDRRSMFEARRAANVPGGWGCPLE